MKHESNFKAYCVMCSKSVDLSNMVKRALISHAQGKRHKKAMIKKQVPSMESFIKTDKTKVDTEGSTDQPSQVV